MSSDSIRIIVWSLLLIGVETTQTSAAGDSIKVRSLERGTYLAPQLKYRYPSINFYGTDPDHRKLVYRPNNKYISGVRVLALGIMFEVSASLTPGDRTVSRFGKTNASDFTINAMKPRWFGDFQWVNYEGTYLRRSWEDYPRDQPLPLRSDMSIRMRSLSVTWIFRPGSFSMRSAYLFSERQILSGGSPLLRAGLTRFLISDPGTLIGEQDAEWFPDLADVNGITTHALGIAPGYGYTLVTRDFFLNGTFLAGPAQYWNRYDFSVGTPRYDIQVNWLTSLTISLGYNGARFFGGTSFRSQGFAVRLPQSRLTANQNLVIVMAGYRFEDRGILKQRINKQKWWPLGMNGS